MVRLLKLTEVDKMRHKEMNIEELRVLCKRMRLHAMNMALAAGKRGAHVSGSLSCIEIYAVLYGVIMSYDVNDPLWEDRDRFIAGKEHARLAEYPVMAEMGFFPINKLNSYEENDGLIVGHQRNLELGFEYASMSLGMELSYAVGKAIMAKRCGKNYRIYSLLGDAECEEGAIWEAIITAAHYQLDNMTVIIDRNYMSVDGHTEELMSLYDMQKKFESFGWESVTVDGHDLKTLIEALSYKPKDKPYAVIAQTIKGKGVSFVENNRSWHQAVLSKEQYDQAISEIKKA